MEAHHATVFEAIADAIPDAPALAQGDRLLTYRDVDVRASRISAALADAGLGVQARVAIDLFNCNEWLESLYACLKGRFVPVSINYRYLDDELAYLFENSDSEALIFHASLGERVVRVARRLPNIKVLIQVDDVGGAELPEGVLDYDTVATAYRQAERISRSPDDIVMWYSGGTTGMPKGVLIPVGRSAESSMTREMRLRTLGRFFDSPDTIPLDVVEGAKLFHEQGVAPVSVPAAPLMHSTAVSYSGPAIHYCGGMVVTLENHSFDAHELFRTVERRKVTTITIVGDAFAKPMVRALEEQAATGRPYDASSIRTILSAGIQWSAEVKDKMFEYMPQVILCDNCGSSEGAWYGTSILRKGDPTSTSAFTLAPGVLLLDEDGNPMTGPSDKPGLLASPTSTTGYHKDPEKTQQNFRMINGAWYTTPGDLGMLTEDGKVILIGRGTSVINTGGEKVYPEEVDDVIKQLPEVDDCLVVGTPDERFGQQVTAVIQVRPGAEVTLEQVREHVRSRLAHYKAPRAVVVVPKVPRFPNGKPDYPTTKELAEKALANQS